jgi:hypothetical protein
MTSIAEVIGWKHNHQPGMTCRENSDGVFEITEFPGGIPPQADQDKWTAEYLVQFPEGYDEWKETIQATDAGMPRYLEDHIKDGHDGDAGNEFLQVKYDAKIKLRAEKP